MLAKAPPFPFLALTPTTNISSRWRRPRGNSSVVMVRAGYRRRPMETPGAYELVDDATGDKVIVWGGIDDQHQDTQIPADHLLLSSNWGPSFPPPASGNEGAETAVTNNASPAGSTRKVAANFGRLKAQRVTALVRRNSRMKRETTQNDDEQVAVHPLPDQSVASPSILDSVRKKAFMDALPQSQEFKGTTSGENFDNSGATAKHSPPYIQLSQTTTCEPPKSDTRRDGSSASQLKGSADNLRGWHTRRSHYDLKSESTMQPKRGHKMPAESGFFSRKSFRELGCSEYVIESLKKQQFLRPSHIQAMAFLTVIEGKSCVIVDQSGSGKTLAYLVPVIQRLRQEELQGLSKSSSRCPRVVIVVPTAELASQVLTICRTMSRFGVPFRSMVVTGGFRQRTQLENLQEGVDILIATPGRFMFLVKEGFLELKNLRCAVLDEVDVLFNDEDFEVALQSLINSSPVTVQYLFVTATLPVDVYNNLVEVFPDCEVIMGPGMHRTSPGLEEVLVDCSGEDGSEKTPETAFLNKKTALLKLVEESPVPRTIIFCNKIETCRKVENALKRFDRKGTQLKVLPFHAAVAQDSRLANMKEFTNSQPKGDSLFLVCTDRASRGIDFAGVDHVVLFDFPRDPSEYVRRVGRTARGAGGKGKAFIFVVGKQVSLAQKIMERNKKGHPLHDVPSAYELMN